MLDMYDFENDIWLCHSIGGKCFNFTAFVSASCKWYLIYIVLAFVYLISDSLLRLIFPPLID